VNRTLRIRNLYQRRNRRGFPDEELLSVYRDYGVIKKASRDDNHNRASDDLSSYLLVEPGDLVVNKMKAWQGSIAVSDHHGIVSPAYFVFKPRGREYGRFIHYLLRSNPYIAQYAANSKGIRPGQWDLSIDAFKNISVSIPDAKEQAEISEFLDEEMSHTDQLISEYAQLAALLEEKRTAIITRATTIGMELGAECGPSGSDWVGAIPRHWRFTSLSRHWSVIDCRHVTVEFVADGVPLASVREVQAFDVQLKDAKRTTQEWYRHLIYRDRAPRVGDLIYCRNVSVGSCAYVNTTEQFAMGQDVCLIRSAEQNGRYLNYYLRSSAMAAQLSSLLIGATFKRINVRKIETLMVCVPPRNEQDEIVQYLDEQMTKIDQQKTLTLKAIELLHERKHSLITAAVAGKLDVRTYRGNSRPQEVER
jgi:type I restriction enzyme, S subunit